MLSYSTMKIPRLVMHGHGKSNKGDLRDIGLKLKRCFLLDRGFRPQNSGSTEWKVTYLSVWGTLRQVE